MNNQTRVEKVREALKEVDTTAAFRVVKVEEGSINSVGRGGSWFRVVEIWITDLKLFRESLWEYQRTLTQLISEKTGVESHRIVFSLIFR